MYDNLISNGNYIIPSEYIPTCINLLILVPSIISTLDGLKMPSICRYEFARSKEEECALDNDESTIKVSKIKERKTQYFNQSKHTIIQVHPELVCNTIAKPTLFQICAHLMHTYTIITQEH